MIVLGADGPTFTLGGWVAWIIAAGGLAGAITAITVFTRKVLLPGVRALFVAGESMRVMAGIAERFGADGHETISAELQALVANDELSAENQQEMLIRLSAIANTTEVIDKKLTETRHKIIGEFATLKLGGQTTLSVVEAIERTSMTLREVKEDLRTLKADIDTLRRSSP